MNLETSPCIDRGDARRPKGVAETCKDKTRSELTSFDRSGELLETKSMPGSFVTDKCDRIEICNEWKPTLLHVGSLAGIFALFVSFACLLASFAILKASNGVSVDQWKYQPSTYIAIFTTIGNQAVRYASIQGVAIAWWLKAIRGSTIASLHFDWKGGLNFFRALLAGRRTNLLTLACIFSTLVTIDGPLLQRASSVVSDPIIGITVPLNFSITPELPTGFSGHWVAVNSNEGDTVFSAHIPTSNGSMKNREASLSDSRLSYIIQDILNDEPMTGLVSGCPGICKSTIRAPALVITNCSSRLYPATFGEKGIHRDGSVTLNQTLFLVDADLMVHGEFEAIDLNTGVAQMENCQGHFSLSSCTLASGIGEYDVIVKGNVVTVNASTPPTLVSVANNTRVNETAFHQYHTSTLAGIVYAAQVLYAGFVERQYAPDGPSPYLTDGTLYLQYIEKLGVSCPSFRSPQADVLQYLNMVMFRSGIWSAQNDNITYLAANLDPGLTANQTVTGYVEGVQNIFRTDFKFFYIALVLELLSILFVFSSYWGWWNLGRTVSFSPLEVAKAFDSPLLARSNTNSTGKQVAIRIGDAPVQYGMVPSTPLYGPSGDRLVFGHPDHMQLPRKRSDLVP